jgi:hypothetical protein
MAVITRDLEAELRNFAQYSQSVAEDCVGQARQTWIERAVWAEECAAAARGAVDPMRESRIARARGLAQAIAECRDDARLDGIREGAAEIVTLLGEQS